jgi:hypothetical protein
MFSPQQYLLTPDADKEDSGSERVISPLSLTDILHI